MKKLLVLLFSILISFNSYGEWIEITKSTNGSTYYIDHSSIKKNDGYVYFWELSDFINSTSDMKSAIAYKEGDCNIIRHHILALTFYTMPMGNGESTESTGDWSEWIYPIPGAVGNTLLNNACDFID